MPTHTFTQDDAIHHSFATKTDRINEFLSKATIYYRRHQTRKQLSALSADQLDDIGLNKEEALAESQKPFWK